jgi:hypothetical protein
MMIEIGKKASGRGVENHPGVLAAFRRLAARNSNASKARLHAMARDASYPSLQFKRVNDKEPIYSVRINAAYRALGLLEGGAVHWFRIGAHDEYARILKIATRKKKSDG